MTATTTFLAANLATSTLAANLSSGATSMTVAPGTGSRFPALAANQQFALVLVDNATGAQHEVVYVTAVVGDAFTIVRAREGTVARSWLLGDQVSNVVTAGLVNSALVQLPALQQQAGNYAVDTGAADAGVVTLSTVPTSYAAGLVVRTTKVASPNTGAYTLDVNGLGPQDVTRADGSALSAGDLPASVTFAVIHDGAQFVLQPISAATGITASQLQQQTGNYGADIGTANSLVVVLNPVPASLASLNGVPIRIKKSAVANTGGCTLNVNALGAKVMLFPDGSAMTSGVLPANGTIAVAYDSVLDVFELLSVTAPSLTAVQLQRQTGNYAVDTGTSNALAITLAPAPAALSDLVGVPIRVTKSSSANTGGATLNVNGLGAVAIKYANGNTMKSGDLPASGEFVVLYDGVAFTLVTLTGPSQVFNFLGGQSVSSSGWVRIGNLMVQWGLTPAYSSADGVKTINFVTPFVVGCYGVQMTAVNASGSTALSHDAFPQVVDHTSSLLSFDMVMQATDGSAQSTQFPSTWFAYGQ